MTSAQYMREYRIKNPSYAKKNDEQTKILRAIKVKYIWDYKASKGCTDCGEKDPIVLDLDHIDPNTKIHEPSSLGKYSWKTLKDEIAKCEVRCANCHRRRTHIEKHWISSRIGDGNGL